VGQMRQFYDGGTRSQESMWLLPLVRHIFWTGDRRLFPNIYNLLLIASSFLFGPQPSSTPSLGTIFLFSIGHAELACLFPRSSGDPRYKCHTKPEDHNAKPCRSNQGEEDPKMQDFV
jgi:hypothetical protein